MFFELFLWWFYVVFLLGKIVNCKCTECLCKQEFEIVEAEELLNLIQHGRLTQEQITFLKSRVGSDLCKHCFIGTHHKN